jgi:hypothetical protein
MHMYIKRGIKHCIRSDNLSAGDSTSIRCCNYLHVVITPIRIMDDVCSIQLRAERRLQERNQMKLFREVKQPEFAGKGKG